MHTEWKRPKIASLTLIHCSRHIMSRDRSPLMNGAPSTPTRFASVMAEHGSFYGSNGAERRQSHGWVPCTWTNTVVPPGSYVGAQRLELGAPLRGRFFLLTAPKPSLGSEGRNRGLKLGIVSSEVLAACLPPLLSDTNYPWVRTHTVSLGPWLRGGTRSTAPFSIRHRSHRGRHNTES